MIDNIKIEKNSKILIAVSGGIDSVCLLHFLVSKKSQFNLTLEVINIDHQIRGEESFKDSMFVKSLCEKYNVNFNFSKVDAVNFSKENNYSLEQGARILRYKIFDEFLSSHEGFKLATAHHLRDNAETVLFNIFRGAGLKGLSGICQNSDKIIRPFINISKEEIINYAKENNLSYCTDSTNIDNYYSRNYIRNILLPLINEKFPAFENNMIKLSNISRMEDEYLDKLATEKIQNINDKYYLNINLDEVIFKRATIIILKKLGIIKDYEKTHIDSIYNLIFNQTGASICLPKNVIATRDYDNIRFEIISNNIEKIEPININKFDLIDNIIYFGNYEIYFSTDPSSLFFDFDKLPNLITIRTKKDGDIFTKFGSGTKKLKEYFIDKKIPSTSRNLIPLICVNNVVYIVSTLEISNNIKCDKTTKTKLYLHVRLSK